ncbi:hypothetical protein D3C78_739960 [compost metagenome]
MHVLVETAAVAVVDLEGLADAACPHAAVVLTHAQFAEAFDQRVHLGIPQGSGGRLVAQRGVGAGGEGFRARVEAGGAVVWLKGIDWIYRVKRIDRDYRINWRDRLDRYQRGVAQEPVIALLLQAVAERAGIHERTTGQGKTTVAAVTIDQHQLTVGRARLIAGVGDKQAVAAAGIAQHLEQVALFAGQVGVHGEHAAATQIALDGQGLECAARLELHRAATIHRQVGEVGLAGHRPGGVLQGKIEAAVFCAVDQGGAFEVGAQAGQADVPGIVIFRINVASVRFGAQNCLGNTTVLTKVQGAIDQMYVQPSGLLGMEALSAC